MYLNKIIKISIFIIMILFMTQLTFAEDMCRIYSSDNWVGINKTFNYVIKIVANKKVGRVLLRLHYDKTYLKFLGGENATDIDGDVLIEKNIDANRELLRVKFEALKMGETKIEVLSFDILDANNKPFKDVKHGYSIISIRNTNSLSTQIDYKNYKKNIRKCYERNIDFEEKYHSMFDSIIGEVTKDNILYADYLYKKNNELPYINGLIENYYNTVDNTDINNPMYDLRDLGIDNGILDIVYNDFDNDNQKELLIITLNKLLLEEDSNYAFKYQIGFKVADIINNEVVESNVLYNDASFDFPIFDIKIGIRDYNNEKIIYCHSSGWWDFHTDGCNNFINNYMYKNSRLYSYDGFEYLEYGDISGEDEEKWFDEYKKKKLKYICDNNFVGINSEEDFNIAFNKTIYNKRYNDSGELFEDEDNDGKDIFDSDDFKYVYVIYRHSERIHMDYLQKFNRLK